MPFWRTLMVSRMTKLDPLLLVPRPPRQCRLLVCLTKENVQPAPWKSMMAKEVGMKMREMI